MKFDQQTDQFSTPKKKCGRKKFRETRHPVYKGVRERNGDKWVCEIRVPKKKSRIWLGTYPTAEMAAVAHDVASLALKGSMAVLNFPNLVSCIPRPRSSSAKDIRVAAQQAAESLIRPKPNSPVVAEIEVVVGGEVEEEPKLKSFWDEDDVFNMPGVVESMAEGLLLTPPPLRRAFTWDDVDFNITCDDYFTLLWTGH